MLIQIDESLTIHTRYLVEYKFSEKYDNEQKFEIVMKGIEHVKKFDSWTELQTYREKFNKMIKECTVSCSVLDY